MNNIVRGATANQGILVGYGASDNINSVLVQGNSVYLNGSGSNAGGGIWFDAAIESVIHIDNNTVFSNNGDNISVTYLTTGAGGLVTINGNISFYALGPPGDTANSGIVVDGTVSTTVVGNVCFNNSGAGIIVRHAATRDVISANVIYDNNKVGLSLGGIHLGVGGDSTFPQDITISANKLYDDQGGSVTQTLGIVMVAGANANQVVDNTIYNATTAISDAGTGNRKINNIGYNPVGTTAATSTGTTGSTITAGGSPETHYIKQSATFNAAVAKNGNAICTVPSANVPCVVDLGPGESYVVTWTTTQPTYTKDVH